MTAISTRQGTPLPYVLKSIMHEGKMVQHAVMQCCDCSEKASFVWNHREAPHDITQKFERLGWAIYRNKARCPTHKISRAKQQAAFARERLKNMETKTLSLVKPDRKVTRSYLLTIDEKGEPTLTPIDNAQEMLFGDKTYLVIPQKSD